MRFAIMLNGVNAKGNTPHAIGFCEALLAAGHELGCIFFSGESVALAMSDPDSASELEQWQAIAERSGTELSLCSNSASARGLTPEKLPEHCAIAGLAYWLEQDSRAQRSLRFSG